MTKGTTWKTYEAELEYAQLFKRNMDHGSNDNDAGRTVASKGGQTKVTLLVTEEVKDQMIADGIPEKSMGYDMFKHDPEKDLYRYVAKRPWNSPFKDDDGNIVVFGPPNVVDYPASVAALEAAKESGEEVTAVQWDSNVNIGNGSTGKVKFSIYKNGNKRIVRLEGVAVVEHVPYEAAGSDQVRF